MKIKTLFFAALIASFQPAALFAQETRGVRWLATDSDEAKALEDKRPRTQTEKDVLPALPVELGQGQSGAFLLQDILFEGNTAFSDEALKQLGQDWLGKTVIATDLKESGFGSVNTACSTVI